MKKSLLILPFLALAGAAEAGERVFDASITVAVSGKSTDAVRADIRRAAIQACRRAQQKADAAGAWLVTSSHACRAEAVRNAEAALQGQTVAQSGSPRQIARAN